MVADVLAHLKWVLFPAWLERFPTLKHALSATIDFFAAPLTGLRTRSYWPELLAALLIAALVFYLRDRRPGDGPLAFFRFVVPKDSFLHRSTWVDCKLIVANSIICPSINLLWRINAALFAGAIMQALIVVFGPPPHLLQWGTTTLVVYTFLIAMASDFGYYVYHYLMHHVSWMWAFHKVHHSAERLTVFANVRAHPVEILFDGPFRAAGIALILGPALYLGTGEARLITVLGMTLSAAFVGAIGAQLHHSHIWLSWGRTLNHVLISPAMHQIHHSKAPRHWNKNLGGSFALWDWMFGTIYLPETREVLSFGVSDHEPQPHPTLFAAYTAPFLEILPTRLTAPSPVRSKGSG